MPGPARCLLLVVACLGLAGPSSVWAQANDEQAFVQWLAAADCRDLRAESLFLGKSLARSGDNLRKWKMDLRHRIAKFRGLYARRCLEKDRAWLYECISIKRALDFMRNALVADGDQLGEARALRWTLANRRERIEQRQDELCTDNEIASASGP